MKIPELIRNLRRSDVAMAVASAASGLLLAAAFAPAEKSEIAWFALVPMLVACAYADFRQSLRIGWITGLAFWLASMVWLTHVTVFGWLLLCAYCALYFVPLSMVAAWWFHKYDVSNIALNLLFILVAASVWVLSEYARFTLFTGFPWNPLGACQAINLVFIQHASWGGVYCISGLLMVMNAAISLTVLRYLRRHARLGRTIHVELTVAMCLLIAAFFSGSKLLKSVTDEGEPVSVALVQPAIPQEKKWTVESEEMIYTRLNDLTSQAVMWTKPDLVVWPETALPVDVRLSDVWYELCYNLSLLGSPILVGSMDSETFADRKPRYYNSSFLFATNGVIIDEYDKNHLVLIGEYIPLHEYVDVVNALTPVMESFSPGTTNTVFQLPGRGTPFSSLICFEDTMPYLARRSVRNGARMLINQTNDAWFDPSAASRQHMMLSVFRTVENRVPMVRCANTGYSCHIKASGEIRETMHGESGRHDAQGFLLTSVVVPTENMTQTFYTRHGDVFAILCSVIGFPIVVVAYRDRRKLPQPV